MHQKPRDPVIAYFENDRISDQKERFRMVWKVDLFVLVYVSDDENQRKNNATRSLLLWKNLLHTTSIKTREQYTSEPQGRLYMSTHPVQY